MTSAMYTGTTFLRELLEAIPILTDVVLTRDLASDEDGPFYLFDCINRVWRAPQVNLNSVGSYFTSLNEGRDKVLFVEGHIHEHWMHSLVFFVPFYHKVVAPIRHPFDSMLTQYMRREPSILNDTPQDYYKHGGWVWSYLQILALKKHRPKDVVLVPVDLLGQEPVAQRLVILNSLLEDVGIRVSERDEEHQKFYQLARDWNPINTHPGEKIVSLEVRQEITKRLDLAMVYYYLQQVGINYPYKA